MPPTFAQAIAAPFAWKGAPPRAGASALPFDYAKADDRELASRAAQGGEPAFRELLARYEQRRSTSFGALAGAGTFAAPQVFGD